jgi:glycosyltransferase involved in cell wall biosynthesis
MTTAIYTVGLEAGTVGLMPWRTVLEVARHWQAQGLAVRVFAGGRQTGEGRLGGVTVVNVRKPRSHADAEAFRHALAAHGVGILYFPVAPGLVNARVRSLLRQRGVRLVWYMPGAWYGRRQILAASRFLAWWRVLPYWRQALWPKRLWTRRLLADGPVPLIAMTWYTCDRLVAAGYPRTFVHAIPPGREASVTGEDGETPWYTTLAPALSGQPFFLFFGPPHPIRGVVHLVAAFRRFAAASPTGRLVCLFRPDGNVDPEPVRRLVARAGLPGRLLAVWESVGAADRHAFLQHCRAVVKPFLLVPSEIPLAVIEAAQHGKPVIGFGPDGTGAFIETFGVQVPHGDVGALATAMRRLVTDAALHAERCQEALRICAAHPTWGQVADGWRLAAANKA